MSSRAAWRLETLGFVNVFDYTAGKTDWLSNGLPSEGKLADEARIGAIAHPDVTTCQPGQRVGDVGRDVDLCVVVNPECIVLGDLRGKALRGDPSARVEDVMNPGPSTYRPNVSVKTMAHHMLETGARKVLVADADGLLIGSLTFEDVLTALHRR